ncbi:MAG: aminodeoxychorismate synthase component I [Geobacteraceae bacterium]|nr:aminodeoxychorismate synthase component I [Geobacteraceae bacterium]
MPTVEPLIRLDSFGRGEFAHSWRFGGYVERISAVSPDELMPLLTRVDEYAKRGFYAAGFVSYEAASGINPDLPTLEKRDGLPLAWFAIFRERLEAAATPVSGISELPLLQPVISEADFIQRVKRIKRYIADGDCYQVNYTFNMEGEFSGDPLQLYLQAAGKQSAPFCAYIETDDFAIISPSPELFFSLKNGVIKTRPMKGTAPRGRWLAEDTEQIEALKGSEKDRAENLMIVDLLRNDLGIIARTGTVQVESLFDVESYPTLHQMTSTITAELKQETTLPQIFSALFPCGSITGAPKKRSVEIILELESAPRGCYCGAIGYVAPGGEALFSVAIRTAYLDKKRQLLTLGIGSGITSDSSPEHEYRECLLKSSFLFEEEFALIESLRREDGSYPLMERHLARLCCSAELFGFTVDLEAIRHALESHGQSASGTQKVRLLLARNGSFTITSEPVPADERPLRIAISVTRVDSNDRFRYHKTTRRVPIDTARQAMPEVDEVVFLNERGELTEGSYHNIFLKIDGRLLTPRLESGLLGGVMRQKLLDDGDAAEAILYPEDLERAEEILLTNGVRGVRKCVYSRQPPAYV